MYRRFKPVISFNVPKANEVGMIQPIMGNHYFVDPVNGSDGKRGDEINHPLLTLEAAYDKCVDGQGDVISCFPGNQNIAAAGGLACNKEGVTIQAMNYGHPPMCNGESFTIRNHSSITDAPAVHITAPTKFIGMGITGRDITQESVFIEGTGGFSGGFNAFINCRFSAWYGAMDALVRMESGPALNLFQGCTFDGLFSGLGTGAIVGRSFYLTILGCDFRSVGNMKYAVVFDTTAPAEVLIDGNYLGGCGGGKFLDNASLASTGIISNNRVGGANKAAMFENLTNSTIKFAGNMYNDS